MKRMRGGFYGLMTLVLLSILAGTRGGAQSSGGAETQAFAKLPATFMGKLPCADCPGIDAQLNLNANHTFESRMTYEERNTHFGDHGTWQVKGGKLVLTGQGAAQQIYAIPNAETLRQLDADGNPITSKLPYDLKRAPTFKPLGRRSKADFVIENRQWNLVQIGAAPVKRGAFISLDKGHRVSGSGGCNNLTGGYELKGNQLKFEKVATTRMVCPHGMETEDSLLEALGQVVTWKISDDNLELFDNGGHMLAQFAPDSE